MLLNDKQIVRLARKGMIEPFKSGLVERDDEGERIISYGTSSFGYDVRVGHEFFVISNAKARVIDPKQFDKDCCVRVVGDECWIPPGGFVLASTMEYLRMPRNVTALCTNKSTYARCGLTMPTTVMEAGWEGIITLELANPTSLPAKVYAGEGIAQLLFFKGRKPYLSYGERGGKYQGQTGVTFPR